MVSLSTIAAILYFGLYILLLSFLAIQVHMTQKHKDKKSFFKAIWSKRAIYGQILIHFYDTATDIGVMVEWYLLAQKDQSNIHINMYSLVWATISFLIIYRVLSAIMVLIASYNTDSGIAQTIFDIFLALMDMYVVKVVYKSIKTHKSEPTSKQKAIQLMESIFESLPQVILQTVFIVRTSKASTLYLVVISLIASVLSVANKYVWIDKDSSLAKARDPHWKPNKACFNVCCASDTTAFIREIPKCTQHSLNDMTAIRRRWKTDDNTDEAPAQIGTHEQKYNDDEETDIIQMAVEKADHKIKDGVKFLISKGGRVSTIEFIAEFLYSSKFDPEAVGEFITMLESSALSEDNHRRLMSEYMKWIDLRGNSFMVSFRHFLTDYGFRLPKEAQKTDRLIDEFSKAFVRDNPDILDSSDKVLILSYAVLMLNTEFHNERAKKAVMDSDEKLMDFDKFKDIVGDQEIDEQILEDVFTSIADEALTVSQQSVPLFSSLMKNVNIAVFSTTSISSSCSVCYAKKAQYKCDICYYYLCEDCYEDNIYIYHKNECVRRWYLIRVLWRFCYIASRFIVLSLLWAVIGGIFFIIFVSVSWLYWCIMFWFGWIRKAVDDKNMCLGYGVAMIYGAVSLISTPSTSSVSMAISHGLEIGIALIVITIFAYNDEIECDGLCTDPSIRAASANVLIFMFIVGGWSLFFVDLFCYVLLIRNGIFLHSASLTAFGTFADGLSEKIE